MEPPPTDPAPAVLRWTEGGRELSARWRCERPGPPPSRVVIADDTISASAALRLAREGTALLWRGDFQNARHLLQALGRRVDRPGRQGSAAAGDDAPAAAFQRHRQAQSQRAGLLAMLLIPLEADRRIPLRRAPDLRAACDQAWGPPVPDEAGSVVSLRELLGIVSAFEWRKNGVAVAALGAAPGDRIHPHYGVFSPVRGEYVDLVAQAPLPPGATTAFDIGTGTGVLAAVLARRGIASVVATDIDPRALACAADNLQRLGLAARVQLRQVDLFPPGQASVVVCNPPWVPARPGSPLERAVYDEGSRMLLGFLRGLPEHLAARGEGWLILSDLAEQLGLRSKEMLLAAIDGAGLRVLGRIDGRPRHPKAFDPSDPLHRARAAEVTSLWRLARRA